jgi:ABC-2 type transport system permease protein
MKNGGNFLAVLRKELTVYFATPIFYVTGFFFLLLGGYFFYTNTWYYSLVSFQAAQNPMMAGELNAHTMIFRPLFGVLSVVLLLLLPLITMRLLAEEKRSGTAELLFTYPLTDWAVILGKFLAALLIYIIMLSCTLGYALAYLIVDRPDWSTLAATYLGMVLFGGACLSLGLFTSSLTENQIIAGVMGFALLMIFWTIGWQQELGAMGWKGIFGAISLLDHYENFTKGVIDTRDLVYYLSFIFFFLFLTKRQLESRRWRA